MPESRFDRLVLVLGVCALAGLVVLIVPAWREYASSGDPSRPGSAPSPAAPSTAGAARRVGRTPSGSPAATTTATRPASTSPSGKSSPVRKPRQPRIAKLTLLAANGDCWVEARSGSASGRLLYAGILGQGDILALSEPVLWLRLGAPQNLVGWVGTKSVRNLPSAAATVVATPAGVRTLGLG